MLDKSFQRAPAHTIGGPAEAAASPVTPRRVKGGIDEYISQLCSDFGIDLPACSGTDKLESPSKRPQSPRHEIVSKIRFLFYKDREKLDRSMEELRLSWPKTTRIDPEGINRLLLNRLDKALLSTPRAAKLKFSRPNDLAPESNGAKVRC